MKLKRTLQTIWQKRKLSILFGVPTLILAIIFVVAIGRPSSTLAEQPNFTDFPTTTPNASPKWITNGPDGNIWYSQDNGFARITPSGVITEFPLSPPYELGWDILVGPDGNLWGSSIHSTTNEMRIVRITTSGVITEFPLLTPTQTLSRITNGPDGNLWFTDSTNNKVERITPLGVITEFNVPTPSSVVSSIAAGPDGNLWFTEHGVDQIGRITPSGTITEFSVPNDPGTLTGFITGPDGNLWFTQQFPAAVNKITPSGVVTQYLTPTPSNGIYIINGPDGNIWYTDPTNAIIGRITTSGVITEFNVPGATAVGIITIGPDGNLWFTAGSSKIGRITPAGVVTTFNTPSSSSPGFIITGPDGNIWYDDSSWDRITRVDVTPAISSVIPRPNGSGTRIAVAGNNFADVTSVTLGADTTTQSPCPSTVTAPCFTIVSENAVVVRSPNLLTSSASLHMTNAWGVGNDITVDALSDAISSAGTFTPTYLEPDARNPWDITVDSDGNAWLVEYNPNVIARITPAGVRTEFTLPGGADGLTTGPDGNIWYTDFLADKVNRLTPGGTVTEFNIPTALGRPNFITTGPDGNLWFTEYGGSRIGRITTSGVITEFSLPTPNSGPNRITTGPDGNLWFTESGSNQIGTITTGGTITEYASSGYPEDITTGPDGNLWFTQPDDDVISRITTSGTVTTFTIPTATSYPYGITQGPDGNLWFTESGANRIGRITTAGAITEYAYSAADDYGNYIASDSDALWFTTSDSADRLSFATTPPTPPTPPAPTPTPTPPAPTPGTTKPSTGGSTPTPTPTPEADDETTPIAPLIINLSDIPEFVDSSGYTTTAQPGQQYLFTPTTPDNSQQYLITVVGAENGSVQFIIAPQDSSSSQTLQILDSRTDQLDVNGDGRPDISIRIVDANPNAIRIEFAAYTSNDLPALAAPSAWRWIKRIAPLLVVFPYLLFIILAIIIAILTRTLVREAQTVRALRRLYNTQLELARGKEMFLQLASHYIRTPITLIRSGLDLAQSEAKDNPSIAQKLPAVMKSADGLGKYAEILLQRTSAQLLVSQPVDQLTSEQMSHWTSLRRPAFWVPVGGILLLIVVANVLLALLPGEGETSWVGLATQAALGVLVIVAFYAVLRKRHLNEQLQARLAQALNSQSQLDEDRTRFMEQVMAGLKVDGDRLQTQIQALGNSEVLEPVNAGLNQLQTLLARFTLATQLQFVTQAPGFQTVPLDLLLQPSETTATAIASKDIQLTTTGQGELVARNPQLFQYVAQSLIDNAVAYSNPGGEVTVSCQQHARHALLTVTDKGKGMSSEYADQWFKPFSKVEGALDFTHEGAGLSLYLDKLIVTYLGGDISLVSAPGRGTTATVTLPTK